MLPPWQEDFDPPPIPKRNVLEINVDANDRLLVEGELMADVNDLKELTKRFLTNEGVDPNLSDSPQDAVVSMINDQRCTYKIYIQIQDQIKMAYREVRDEVSLERFGHSFADITEEQRKEIKKEYPMKFSEAEPQL